MRNHSPHHIRLQNHTLCYEIPLETTLRFEIAPDCALASVAWPPAHDLLSLALFSCTFYLTGLTRFSSLSCWLWEEKSGKPRAGTAAARRRERDPRGRKTPRQQKKMLIRGNELRKLFEMNNLAFYDAENELILERKRAQFKPKNGRKRAFLCLRTRKRDAPGAAA